MIHIAIGTKAQFIKMVPVIQELQRRSIKFNLIDLGQHSLITENLRKEFGIKEPDICLSKGRNVSHLFKGLMWLIRLFFKGFNIKWIKENVFMNRKGVCLIHGDTVSTLLALYLAKCAGLKTAHIEAGLRSYNYFEPFPEEVLRVSSMRFSDILFVPSRWALDNLKKMGLLKKTILLPYNTSFEATFYSLNKKVNLNLNLEKFALFTVHRMENIFSKKRLEFILSLISKITNKLPVVFIQHEPTINQIRRFRLQEKLNEIKNVYFFKILSHTHFIHLINSCQFLVTDGGSIQEEAFYLGKPCLLLRRYTERIEGLGENVLLSKFDEKKIKYFINNYKEFDRKKVVFDGDSASLVIVNSLEKYV